MTVLTQLPNNGNIIMEHIKFKRSSLAQNST